MTVSNVGNYMPASYLIRAIIMILIFSGSIISAGAEALPSEYQVKSAFIYNFAKYVDWPLNSFANMNSPVIITILGNNPYGNAFDAIGGKPVKSRKIEIRQASTIDDVDNCHILFVSVSEKQSLAQVLDFARNRRILTVSDMKGFVQDGGIIALVLVEGKIRFDINLSSARRSGLKISSQLLKLARIVID